MKIKFNKLNKLLFISIILFSTSCAMFEIVENEYVVESILIDKLIHKNKSNSSLNATPIYSNGNIKFAFINNKTNELEYVLKLKPIKFKSLQNDSIFFIELDTIIKHLVGLEYYNSLEINDTIKFIEKKKEIKIKK